MRIHLFYNELPNLYYFYCLQLFWAVVTPWEWEMFHKKWGVSSSLYPISMGMGAAPLSGSINDFPIFQAIKSSKGAHVPLFIAIIFLTVRQMYLGAKKNCTISEKRKIRETSGQGPKQNLCVHMSEYTLKRF